MTRILFAIGADIDGEITTRKVNSILQDIDDALVAVSLPKNELKLTDRSNERLRHVHMHEPSDDACNVCRGKLSISVIE